MVSSDEEDTYQESRRLPAHSRIGGHGAAAVAQEKQTWPSDFLKSAECHDHITRYLTDDPSIQLYALNSQKLWRALTGNPYRRDYEPKQSAYVG